MLVSFEAREMPTDVLVRLAEEVFEDMRAGRIEAGAAFSVAGWLLRIALQKLEVSA